MKQTQSVTVPRAETSGTLLNLNFKQIMKQNKRLFTGVMLFVWLTSSTVTLLSYTPSYVAKGMVMIKDTALTAKYVTGDNYETTTSQSTSSVINTMGLLKTDTYMQSLWEYFSQQHPEELKKIHVKDFTDWEAYFGDGSKFIKYSNLPGTDMIDIDFKWSNPVIAKEGLDVVIGNFRDLSLQLNQTEQRERGRFLAGQITDIQNKLIAVRQRISQYKEQNEVIDTTEENANLARARVNLRTDLETANAEAAGKMQQLSGYQQLLGMNAHQAVVASAVGRNEVLGKLYQDLYSARSERKSLLTRYTETSTKVQDTDSRINQLEGNIRKELTRTIGHAPDSIELKDPAAVADSTRSDAIAHMLSAKTDAMELGARKAALQQYLGQLNTRAKKLTQAEAVLANFKIEEASLDESLRILKQKELDAQLKESQTLSNVFVVEAPRVPIKASFPTQKHLLVLDLILGIALGAAAVFIRYSLQNKPASFLNPFSGSLASALSLNGKDASLAEAN